MTVMIGENEVQDFKDVMPFSDDAEDSAAPFDGKGDEQGKFIATARKRLQTCVTYWNENYQIAKDDLAFLGGDQWTADDRAVREAQKLPVMTINKLPQNVDLVTGRWRKQKTSINLIPRNIHDDIQGVYQAIDTLKSDGFTINNTDNIHKNMQSAGRHQYDSTEVMEGLMRNIEVESSAEVHYTLAYMQAVESGFGWLRVRSDYTTEKSFDQNIIIESLPDRFSALIDPYARSPDFSDANYGFINTLVSREEFKEMYPEAAEPLSFNDLTDIDNEGEQDAVRIMEYYWREKETRTMLGFSDGKIVDGKDLQPTAIAQLANLGVTVVNQKKVQRNCVYWAKITETEILAEKRVWPGEFIPLIPVLGKTKFVNGRRYYVGLCHHAKDAQRAYNIGRSATVEAITTSTKAKWLADKNSIEDEDVPTWQKANDPNVAVLLYKGQQGVEKPQQIQQTQSPVAELQMALAMSDDIKATTGIYDSSLGAKSNETSGVAIQGRQQQGDDITYVFPDNMDFAVKRVGRSCVDAVPVYYDAERTIRIMKPDGMEDFITINSVQDKDGSPHLINDLSKATYDISIETKPYSASEKQEVFEGLMSFLEKIPNIAPLIADLCIRESDVPLAKEIADRLRRTVPPQYLHDPDPNQAAQQQQQQSAMQNQQMQLEQGKISATNKQSDAKVAVAQASLAKAQHETLRASMPPPAPVEPAKKPGNADAAGDEEAIKNTVIRVIASMMKAGVITPAQQPTQGIPQQPPQTAQQGVQ